MADSGHQGWIEIHLDELLKIHGMTATELAERIGMTQANVSILRTGKAKAIRFSTLLAICDVFGCQPGDLLTLKRDGSSSINGSVRAGSGNVILIDAGKKPIAVIKELRGLDSLTLLQAKELVEASPTVVLSGLSRPDAEVAMVKLRAVGAEVEISS